MRIQRCLLSKTNLDFKKVFETAQAIETAAKHAQDLQSVTLDMSLTQSQKVNKLSQAPRPKNQLVHNLKGSCFRCWSKEHKKAHECN
ncbi:hypothetical protein HOLleu_23638 [Holothuria leucospilota]|uniref:Uncharacterized protein n=1 Tax=Holothuria leucospilota TaxID=206669 RepID=A0A9Q1BV52_HOLLE|nr:hypothetical protein HOLleu_23638 [Holothuria leucospilota]